MSFVKGGVREMMIARPDGQKHLIVYKHPDQNVPFWSQLTVDADECAVFFKDGRVQGVLPTGRHTLQTQNIPFLNNLVNRFTGGDVFISEIFFVKTQPLRGVPFGGPLESLEDPLLFEFVTPRIFGEFSLVVVDPIRFIVAYVGQAAAGDNDQVLGWIKGLFFTSVKTVIGQVCAQQQKSLLNLGGMTGELAQRIVQSAPNLEEVGVRILQLGNFNINFSAEDQRLLREANRSRAEARRGVGIASDVARAKQFEIDQRFQQDARYVQQLAGSFQNYAAGQAMIGAGQGMAQGGGGGGGVAALGAQVGVGMAMAGMMTGAQPGQPAGPQFIPPGAAQAGAYPAAPTAAAGRVPCPRCAAQVPPGKFCAECGQVLQAPGARKFCSGCGVDLGGAKFCPSCGTPAAPPA